MNDLLNQLSRVLCVTDKAEKNVCKGANKKKNSSKKQGFKKLRFNLKMKLFRCKLYLWKFLFNNFSLIELLFNKIMFWADNDCINIQYIIQIKRIERAWMREFRFSNC